MESTDGDMDASQLKQLKKLHAENAKLKKIYAELALMHNALQDVVPKNYSLGMANPNDGYTTTTFKF